MQARQPLSNILLIKKIFFSLLLILKNVTQGSYHSNISDNDFGSIWKWGLIYLFLFILSLILTITEQILFAIKNSSKMLIDVNILVKKLMEHNTSYRKKNWNKIVLLKSSYIIYSKMNSIKSNDNINTRHKISL